MDGTFVEALVKNTKPSIERFTINGREYSNTSLSKFYEPEIAELTVHTLAALTGYLGSGVAEITAAGKMLVHIVGPDCVKLLSESFGPWKQRDELMTVKLLRDDFPFGCFLGQEEFSLKLAAMFVPNGDRELLIKAAGNLTDSSVVTSIDDGISQTVKMQTGIGNAENVLVQPYFWLAPWRSFPEIHQPESQFVFRMQPGAKCALFEADGGAWKLSAVESISEWISGHLPAGVPVTVIG